MNTDIEEVTDEMAEDIRAGMDHGQQAVAAILDSVGKGPMKSGLFIAGVATILASTAGLLIGALNLAPQQRKKMLLRLAQDVLDASRQAVTEPRDANTGPGRA